MHWRIQEGARDTPRGPNYFIFMQFSAKYLQKNRSLGLGTLPPPKENSGSATVRRKVLEEVTLGTRSFRDNKDPREGIHFGLKSSGQISRKGLIVFSYFELVNTSTSAGKTMFCFQKSKFLWYVI